MSISDRRRVINILAIIVAVAAVCVGLVYVAGRLTDADRSIRVKFAITTPDGEEIACDPYEMAGRGLLAMHLFGEAKEAGRNTITLDLHPQSLLRIEVKDTEFVYAFAGTERQPLSFDAREGMGLLNGQPIYLDMASSEAIQWLTDERSTEDLRRIRCLSLGGDRRIDLEALTLLAESRVVVFLDNELPPGYLSDIGDALAAARPAGLVAERDVGLAAELAKFDQLSYLCIAADALPDVRHLNDLQLLTIEFRETGRTPSLAPLAKLESLKALWVTNLGDADLAPLAKLTGLRSLTVGNASRLTDLSAIQRLDNLQRLTLIGCDELRDISGIARLNRLSQLVIFDVPDGLTDLTPISNLKWLRLFGVDNDSLEARRSEFDLISKSLPNCRVIGLCLGSRWMLAVVAAGLIAGALARPFLHPRKRAL